MLVLLLAARADALIKADFYWVDGYARATDVVVGKVTAVGTEGTSFDGEVTSALKGDLGHKQVRISLGTDKLPQRLAVGGSWAAIVDGKAVLIHVGDEFLLGQAVDGKPLITAARLTDAQAQTYRTSFPSRTPLFVQLLEDLSKGLHLHEREAALQDMEQTQYSAAWVKKYRRGPIVNDLTHVGLKSAEKVLDLPVKNPRFFWAGDFGNVGRPKNAAMVPTPAHLLVGTDGGVKVFNLAGKDVTQSMGLDSAKPARTCVVGDLDGDRKADLLALDGVVYSRASGIWKDPVALKLPASEVSAAGFGDANHDGKVDLALLLKDGTLVTFLNDDGPVAGWKSSLRKLWTDQAPPARAVFSDYFSGTGELCVMVVRSGDVTRYLCGPQASPADDLPRLCGLNAKTWDCYFKKSAGGPGLRDSEVVDAVVFDFNGWQCQPDLFVVTRDKDGLVGGVFLGYRRYGAFMTNPRIIESLQNGLAASKLDIEPGTLIQAGAGRGQGTRQHLYYLKPNGELWFHRNSGG